MAPKKKSQANGFMVFTMEWKGKYGKHMSVSEATKKTGDIWANMDAQQRAPYNQKAKEQKNNLNTSRNMEKLTCTGTPLSIVEKEKLELENKERQTKRDIEATVKRSVKSAELDTHSFYFIMVNYFTKTLKGGVYVPAELAVCEYSLKHGVSRMYQTLINPGVNIYGHQYEAQSHSDATHNLPLPPNALGEKNLGQIYNDILNFIRDEKTNDYPPLYTHRDCIHIVESVLEFLKADIGANNIDLRIYPIQYLFFIMKENTSRDGEGDKPRSFYITDAFFERDFFEYQSGIACQFHEDADKSKYCTQSYVTRWGYMFSDYMCHDLAITLIPGRHCPKNTNLNAIITPAPSTFNDNTSYISMGTTSSYATKPVADSKIYYEDDEDKSTIPRAGNKTYTTDVSTLGASASTNFRSLSRKSDIDFPALGARVKTSKPAKTPRHEDIANNSNIIEDDFDDKDLNPWNNRSRVVPREPDATHFSIDYNKHDMDSDDCNSTVSYGRGRGSFFNTSLNSFYAASTSSTGRGRGKRS